MKRVDILVQCGAYETIIAYCDELIEANPKSLFAYNLKHETHMNLGKYEESLRDANDMLRNGFERKGLFLKLESLALLVENPTLRLVSQSSSQKEENYTAQLEKTAKRALSRYKSDAQIVYMVTESYRLIGMTDEAIELLEQHLKIKTWDVHCLYQLGLIYQERRQYDRAMACYDRSLESIEQYSQLFREGFARLISESREQVLKEMSTGRGQKCLHVLANT